ncbi:hypothetical protein THRCLA_04036 [Thraustotheca clavata]|uniref:Uncharacterized protein n=1 Tax=Thraustotheca clavata TaxID=74557 RepID=A0A1W0A058_9STRA|nr:hypothetical protein THRCLA_04036 [Thraustotheca clavata]
MDTYVAFSEQNYYNYAMIFLYLQIRQFRRLVLIICPYTLNGGHDLRCPGLKSHKSNNPFQFLIKYEKATIKDQLWAKKSAMALGIAFVNIPYFYPCIGQLAHQPECQIGQCTLCPPEIPITTCCVRGKELMPLSRAGEFVAHSQMTLEGASCWYNDVFQTRDGYIGGYIVKNSWADKDGSSSHSMKYWLQEISEAEDRELCPNSFNTYNWHKFDFPSSMNGNYGQTMNDNNGSKSDDNNENNSINSDTQLFREVFKQYSRANKVPVLLKFIDENVCNPDLDYIIKSISPTTGDHMIKICFNQINYTSGVEVFCWKLPPIQVTSIFTLTSPLCLNPNRLP